jgi:hypothetical protein
MEESDFGRLSTISAANIDSVGWENPPSLSRLG